MPLKRTGLQTIDLPLRPAVCASAAFVGKKEGEGPLGNLFDHVAQDELYGQDTFELAEKRLYLDAIRKAIQKGGLKPENVQFLLGGDLLNQCIAAGFAMRDFPVPFYGLYGACSTMGESLSLAALLECGLSDPRRRSDLLPFLQRRTAVPHAHALWQPALSHRAVDRHRRRLHHPLRHGKRALYHPCDTGPRDRQRDHRRQ